MTFNIELNDEIIKMASTQGIWAVLTIILIFYILKSQENIDAKQEKREKNYPNIISKLTDKFNIMEEVKHDLDEIKIYILKNNKNSEKIAEATKND